MPLYLGDFATGKPVRWFFTTVKASGPPASLVSGAVRVSKNGATTFLSTGVTLSANVLTGMHKVAVLTTGAAYGSGNYMAFLSTGSVNSINVRGQVLAHWSIKGRNLSGYSLTTGNNDTIGTRVWASSTRLLTSGAAVWAAGTKVLTSGGVMWTAGTRILTSGAAVWAAGTKVLTSGGVVWSAGTRTLTSGGTVANSVWAGSTRTLTSGAILITAALTEQSSVPAAAPTLGAAIQWNYQAIRNKRITTATADKMHTSATAVAGTAALSYVSGTQTFTKGKQS